MTTSMWSILYLVWFLKISNDSNRKEVFQKYKPSVKTVTSHFGLSGDTRCKTAFSCTLAKFSKGAKSVAVSGCFATMTSGYIKGIHLVANYRCILKFLQ